MTTLQHPILIIGLDGAQLDLIKQWAAEGHLPHLANLLRRGCVGPLMSTVPALSPPAWISLITGKNPGRHGVFDFVRRRPNSYHFEYAHANLPSLNTIFRRFSAAGRRVAAVNVPFTYPPENVNGIVVSGLGAPDNDRFTYPRTLAADLRRKEYRVNNVCDFDPRQPEAFLDYLHEITEIRGNVWCDLQKQQKWDLFMAVFRDIDTVQTYYWHYFDKQNPWYPRDASLRLRNAVLEHYQQVDKFVGRLIVEAGSNATVCVVSDHGGGGLYGEFRMNNWLRLQGYLALKSMPGRRERMYSLMRSFGITRRGVTTLLGWARAERLREFFPWAERWLPWQHKSLAETVDWRRTVAYGMGHLGILFLNQIGREPEGTVPEGDRQYWIDRITQDLMALRDPATGLPVVTDVLRRESIYDGPYVGSAPDMVIMTRDLGYSTHVGFDFDDDNIITIPDNNERGMHRQAGTFILAGSKIRTGHPVAHATVLDIVPTLLHDAMLPVTEDIDGRVLLEVFSGGIGPNIVEPLYDPTSAVDNKVSAEDEVAIRNHLRTLGYIE